MEAKGNITLQVPIQVIHDMDAICKAKDISRAEFIRIAIIRTLREANA